MFPSECQTVNVSVNLIANRNPRQSINKSNKIHGLNRIYTRHKVEPLSITTAILYVLLNVYHYPFLVENGLSSPQKTIDVKLITTTVFGHAMVI